MNQLKRHYNKWTINEILALQREYELLKMSVSEIAFKHQRSEEAILWKLEGEGFIEKREGFIEKNEIIQDTRSRTTLNEPIIGKEGESKRERVKKEKKNNLNNRVEKLENSINDMKELVKEVVDNFMEQKRIQHTNKKINKRQRLPLRRNQNQNQNAYL